MRKSYLVRIVAILVAMFAQGVLTLNAQVSPKPDVIVVDANAPSHPFPHFWEKMFGSGRAVLSLRDSYRRDLRQVKQATDFEYLRFHAIFHDEVGVYDEDSQGRAVYNFSYVDQIYDGLLANGVKPFVELSFMPQKLAAHNILHSFWYKPNVSPPKDWKDFTADPDPGTAPGVIFCKTAKCQTAPFAIGSPAPCGDIPACVIFAIQRTASTPHLRRNL